MIASSLLDVQDDVATALKEHRPVVALESSLIAHGLPWPLNLATAHEAEEAVREEGAVPATIAIVKGRPTVGLGDEQLEELAHCGNAFKASRRDLAIAVTKRLTAGTTVAATMYLANQVGIQLFATGGIGGAHRGTTHAWDISADLIELTRVPVAVVCAGAKSILDISRTLEVLETQGVPVIGYGTDEFPAFYVRTSGEAVPSRVDNPEEAAALLQAHWLLGGAGVVLAQPVVADVALEQGEFENVLKQAEKHAVSAGVRGKELTPFLLGNLATLTEGKSVRANQALVVANARLAARVARQLKNSA